MVIIHICLNKHQNIKKLAFLRADTRLMQLLNFWLTHTDGQNRALYMVQYDIIQHFHKKSGKNENFNSAVIFYPVMIIL